MKYILLSFCLLTGSFIPLNQNSDNIEEMWKEVYALEAKGLPQSALEVVKKIKTKALATQEYGYLIQSIIYEQKLSAQFEDKDPASYITEFENALNITDHPETKAILQSFIGELYQQYGIMNMYRMQDRTEEVGDENDIAFLSLDEIQRRSIEYYLSSLNIRSSLPINSYEQLWDKSNYELKIEAETLEEFLVFRALGHFINDQSFVSLPKDAFEIEDPNYLSGLNIFKNLIIQSDDNLSYKLTALRLFQRALFLTESKPEVNTLIDLKRIEYVYNHLKQFDKQELYLEALERVTQLEPVNPSVELAYAKIIDHYLREGEAYSIDFDPKAKGFKLAAYGWIQKAKQKFVNGKYQDLIRNQKLKLNAKHLNITLESVVPAGKDFLSYVNYRNSDKVFFRLYQLDTKEWEKYLKIHQIEAKLDFLKKQEIQRAWDKELPGREDYNYHATELVIEGLDYGRYVLISSIYPSFKHLNGNHLDINSFTVSDMSYIHNSMESITEGYVLNRQTGKPFKDVDIEVYSQDYNYSSRRNEYKKIADLKSSDDGYFSFTESEKNFNLVFKRGEDILDTRQGHYNRTYRDRGNPSLVRLFTDRSIYRPGQIIYLKGLVTVNDKADIPEILENRKVTVTLKDVNWQEVESKTFTTNQYGTFDGYFTIPEGLLNGNMTLESKTVNGYGSAYINVEEYKRPKVKLDYLPLEEPFALGDTVTIGGSVQSFSGVNSEGAKVSYQVIEESYLPWWCGFGYYPGHINRVIANGVLESDEQGNFYISFPTTNKDKSFFSYHITCDVTDVTGETVSKSKHLSLSKSALKLSEFYIKDGFEGTIQDYPIQVTDAEGNPVKTSVNIKISQLDHDQTVYQERLWGRTDTLTLNKEDYNKRFPTHRYDSENTIENWKVKSVISDEDYQSSQDNLELSKLKAGVYKIELTLKDSKNREEEIVQYIQITEKKKKALSTKLLWIDSDAPNYEPGQTATIFINAPFNDYQVFYRLGQNRETLRKAWLGDKTKSIEIPITEDMRGGVGVEVLLVIDNRVYREELSLNVPWTNKQLKVKYESFRDKLKPGEETQYSISFEWPGTVKKDLEVLASMYDASLDEMIDHSWSKSFYPNYNFYAKWTGSGFRIIAGRMYFENIYSSYRTNIQGFEPRLNKFGFYLRSLTLREGDMMVAAAMEATPRKAQMRDGIPPPPPVEAEESIYSTEELEIKDGSSNIRENLNETVFFYPDLKTEDGRVTIDFTMNEALTEWKFQLFAHNEDLQYVFDSRNVVTQKELMIEPLMPRFLRQGDKMVMSARVSNLTDKDIVANAEMSLEDVLDQSKLSDDFGLEDNVDSLILRAGSSQLVEWTLNVPSDFKSMLAVTVQVKSDQYSDGERNILPVLSNRKLITEAKPFFVHGNDSKSFTFDALEKAQLSSTLEQVGLTVEVTTDPSWLVLKSLPVIMDVKHNSADKWMDAYYALALADDLIQSNSAIQRALENWEGDDLISELEKKEVFKEISLDATPWVRAALAESQNMQALKILLDKNQVRNKSKSFAIQVKNAQTPNGGFSWFPGGRDSWYTTQYILEVVGRLKQLGLNTPEGINIQSAINYLDNGVLEYYKDISKDEFRIPSQRILHYLFVRSMFQEIMVPNNVYPALKYFKDGLKDKWVELNSHNQALLGQAYKNWSEVEVANAILKSLNERMVRSEDMGYYWNDQAGYYAFNNNVEAHSHMIEFFEAMEADKESTDMLRLWLLRHKQVNEWSTSRTTAAAVYVFMKAMSSDSMSFVPVELVLPKAQEEILFDRGTSSTGYSKKDFSSNLDLELYTDWNVSNKNEQPIWGSIIWQYTEELNNIKAMDDNPLSIEKELFVVELKDNGEILRALADNESYKQGDKIRTRITLKCDRPMSFIHLSDMRASGTEPLFAQSKYEYQDGLSYYQSTKDEATHFYFSDMAKGNYVFEYEVIATQKGTYSNGIARIQSFYAPEFGSHSQGEQIRIE